MALYQANNQDQKTPTKLHVLLIAEVLARLNEVILAMELPSNTSAVQGIAEENGICAAVKRKDKAEKGLALKDTWHITADLRHREIGSYGYGKSMQALKFSNRTGGSVELVRRLKIHAKLNGHNGCVNALNFNDSGDLLASGADDLSIVVWKWAESKLFFKFESGHRSNVFQCKFMPLTGNCLMISCARDGQVRLTEMSSTGEFKRARKLAQHHGAAHKLAMLTNSSHVFYSCGEDGVVYKIDLRQEKPVKQCTTKENSKRIELYSIHAHPFRSSEFCVSGRDPYVSPSLVMEQIVLGIFRVRRPLEELAGPPEVTSNRVLYKLYLEWHNLDLQNVEGGVVKKLCPQHLASGDIKANVTSALYNFDGSEILASYNDEDIYLFDCATSENTHRYSGHRNSATVKGVNFYGPKSEFVVSGSDCGNVFLWDRKSEAVVNFFHADDNGVVNVLEPHPHIPVLATSGLDHDVKVWTPMGERATNLEGLDELVEQNGKDRETERSEPDIDNHMLWLLMRHLRRTHHRRGRNAAAAGDDDEERQENEDSDNDLSSSSASSDEEEEEADDDDPPLSTVRCNQS